MLTMHMDYRAVQSAIIPGRTTLVMLESPPNPRMQICDIQPLCALAHEVIPTVPTLLCSADAGHVHILRHDWIIDPVVLSVVQGSQMFLIPFGLHPEWHALQHHPRCRANIDHPQCEDVQALRASLGSRTE